MAEQTYLDADFGRVSGLPERREKSAVSWWWWVIGVGIVALVGVAFFRHPQWFGKIGSYVSTGAKIANPYGWV